MSYIKINTILKIVASPQIGHQNKAITATRPIQGNMVL